MRYEEIRELLHSHFAKALAAHKQAVADNGRVSAYVASVYQEHLARSKVGADARPSDDQSALDELVLDGILSNAGVPTDLAPDLKSRLLAEYRVADRSYSAAVLAFDKSLEHYELDDEPIAAPKRSGGTKAASVSISILADQFAQYNVKQGVWNTITKAERQRHFDLLVEVLGSSAAASDVTVEDAIRVRDMLLDMPSNRNKKSSTKDRPIAEQVSVEAADKMEQRTVRKYLQTFHSLFAWATLERRVPLNPFDGITIATNTKRLEATARAAFSRVQLAAMVDALDGSTGMTFKTYQKWGSLIGIYTGARLNEISQLEVGDIREVDGVLCFDLNDEGDDKSLKTSAARRLVPVHSHLQLRGLLDVVQSVKAAGHSRLFHTLTYDPKNKWGRALGRWFSPRFLGLLGMKTDRLSFHSLRHSFVTELFQADVEEPMIKSIVGHKRSGVTGAVYFKGYTVRQMRDAVERFDPKRVTADTDIVG